MKHAVPSSVGRAVPALARLGLMLACTLSLVTGGVASAAAPAGKPPQVKLEPSGEQ